MTHRPLYVAISPEELAIVSASPLRKLFLKQSYPVDIHSDREVKEFCALASECRKLGAKIVDRNQIEDLLKQGLQLIKIGRTSVDDDLQLLSHFNSESEWNHDNLEKVFYWDHYLKPSRQISSFFLSDKEALLKLGEQFDNRGALFVKTRTKGNSREYANFDDFKSALGDPSLLISAFKDLIVSDVMDIHRVNVSVSGVLQSMPDEWRHYVYAEKLIASSRAFDCDENGATVDVEHLAIAKRVMVELAQRDFSTSYVLDTCRLRTGEISEIEINNIFSSGIYSEAVIPLLANAFLTA